MRLLAITLALAAGALLLLRPADVNAQPEVTFLFPSEGAVLSEPPALILMCFASPVNIQDLQVGGDFSFNVIMPNSISLGLRIAFHRNGLGVAIEPGIPENPPEGEWRFEWRVTDPDTLEPATGTLNFRVDPDGSPLPEEPPERCDTGASTPGGGQEDDEDGGPDILAISLITTAAAIGAAGVGLILYLVRRRIGFSPHDPPGGEGEGGGH